VKNEHVVTLKSDANSAWIAVLDPSSGKRGRYTVYRLYRWADKRADIIGRELDLNAAKKLVGKREPDKTDSTAQEPNFDHDCDWRKAALKLAKCVIWTIQTGGKLGMGSGMVMKVVDGKKTVERWDKDLIESLAFIGLEVVDKPDKKSKRKSSRRRAESSPQPTTGRDRREMP
jgi:hypothetical protein